MRNYATKILVFLTLYLVTISITKKTYPYSGNSTFSQKVKAFEYIESTSDNDINTIFLGSSIFYRGIVPEVFDQNTSHKTNSYNLGTDGTSTIEISYLLDQFTENHKVENIVIGVWPILPIEEKHKDSSKNLYYHDLSRFLSIVNYTDNWKDLMKHSMAFFKNCIGLNLTRGILSNIKSEKNIPTSFYSSKGFYAADEEFGASKWNDYKLDILKATLEKTERNSNYYNTDAAYMPLNKKDIMLYNFYLDIHDKLLSKGINTYFVYLPNTTYLAKKLNLPSSIVVEPYDEFFDEKFYFDYNHLNKEGAEIFTQELVKSFDNLLVKNKLVQAN